MDGQSTTAAAKQARYRGRHPGASRAAQEKLRLNRPAYYIYYRTRQRAQKAGLEFDLTEEWIEVRLSEGCEVTGLPFDLSFGTRARQNPWCPSVDRIDNTKGYVESNCRLVVWVYNAAKSTWEDEIVMEMAKALSSYELVL